MTPPKSILSNEALMASADSVRPKATVPPAGTIEPLKPDEYKTEGRRGGRAYCPACWPVPGSNAKTRDPKRSAWEKGNRDRPCGKRTNLVRYYLSGGMSCIYCLAHAEDRKKSDEESVAAEDKRIAYAAEKRCDEEMLRERAKEVVGRGRAIKSGYPDLLIRDNAKVELDDCGTAGRVQVWLYVDRTVSS